MWVILEHRDVPKTGRRLPVQVLKKYELWKDLVFRHGPDVLKQFPGFHDEQLKGERGFQRSSRLNLKYRVIYVVEQELVRVLVLDITPHEY